MTSSDFSKSRNTTAAGATHVYWQFSSLPCNLMRAIIGIGLFQVTTGETPSLTAAMLAALLCQLHDHLVYGVPSPLSQLEHTFRSPCDCRHVHIRVRTEDCLFSVSLPRTMQVAGFRFPTLKTTKIAICERLGIDKASCENFAVFFDGFPVVHDLQLVQIKCKSLVQLHPKLRGGQVIGISVSRPS
jgi:hypothetical protein